jgi:ligand-binding sensor domain-containing protein
LNTGRIYTDVYALVIHPQTPDTLYAGTYETGGVIKSIDGGTNWTAVSTGVNWATRTMGLPHTNINSLVIHPQNPDIIYVGTWVGVFKSDNAGANWNAMNTGLTNTNVWIIAIDPQKPDTLYAATEGGGVFKID